MESDVVAGRFALCDPLARGASGTVWRAWDLRTGQYCAAKVLRQRDSGDALRFAREQGIRLTHPNLLTPYSWAAEDEYVVIASRLVTGGSVHTLLGDYGPLATDLVADLLRQLLAGLGHVHAAGIVHRDVTLGNLLLDPAEPGPPHLWLADFGLAVRMADPRLTSTGTVVGTPGYLAPELLAGAPPAPAADLYAAGRVAAALLTGAEDEPAPGTTHSPLERLVEALLEPDPATRPRSATEALAALGPPTGRPPLTAAGEPVTVLVQLPPLPPGWTPAGPVSSPTAGRPAPASAQPAAPQPPGTPPPSTPSPGTPPLSTPPRSNSPLSTPSMSTPSSSPPLSSTPPPSAPSPGTPLPGTPPRSGPPFSTPPGSTPPPSGPPTPSTPSPGTPLLSTPPSTPPPSGPPLPTTPPPSGPPVPNSPPPSGPPRPAPASPSLPPGSVPTSSTGATRAPGGAVRALSRRGLRVRRLIVVAGLLVAAGLVIGGLTIGGTDSGRTPRDGPTTPVPPGRSAAVGAACGWQQEGDIAAGPNGQPLTCVRTDTGYRWAVS